LLVHGLDVSKTGNGHDWDIECWGSALPKFMSYDAKIIGKVNLDIVECHVGYSLHVLWMGEVIMNLTFLSHQ